MIHNFQQASDVLGKPVHNFQQISDILGEPVHNFQQVSDTLERRSGAVAVRSPNLEEAIRRAKAA